MSTLLQRVFGLLHCAADEARRPYLRNLLVNGRLDANDPEQRLARLTIEIDGHDVALEFVLLGFDALRPGFGLDPPPDGFDVLEVPAEARLAPHAHPIAGLMDWLRRRAEPSRPAPL